MRANVGVSVGGCGCGWEGATVRPGACKLVATPRTHRLRIRAAGVMADLQQSSGVGWGEAAYGLSSLPPSPPPPQHTQRPCMPTCATRLGRPASMAASPPSCSSRASSALCCLPHEPGSLRHSTSAGSSRRRAPPAAEGLWCSHVWGTGKREWEARGKGRQGGTSWRVGAHTLPHACVLWVAAACTVACTQRHSAPTSQHTPPVPTATLPTMKPPPLAPTHAFATHLHCAATRAAARLGVTGSLPPLTK